MEHETIEAPKGAEYLANAFAYYLDKIGNGIQYIHDQFAEFPSLDACRTPDEVRSYARSIQNTQPGFASELFAAADRADD